MATMVVQWSRTPANASSSVKGRRRDVDGLSFSNIDHLRQPGPDNVYI